MTSYGTPISPGTGTSPARTILFVTLAAVIGAFVALGAAHYYHFGSSATAPASPLVAVGSSYGKSLLQVDAAAWEAGAKSLDAGGSIEGAVGIVGTSWSTGRTTLYASTINPALSSIIPQGTDETTITVAQRAQMAGAFRAIAQGVASQ